MSARPWGGRCRALTACCCAVMSFAATLPAASGAAEKGVAPDMTWTDTIQLADQDRTAEGLADLGARWVRMDASWYRAEPVSGRYDERFLGEVARAISLARGAGSKVILMVNESPPWASLSGDKNAPPTDPADYASYLRFVATRFAGQVDAWEIWNEPNIPRFWSTGPDAAEYARLLRAAYPAVKAGDPAAKVLFAGVAFNDYDFLERAYAADPDLGRFFDVMATHPYTYGGAPPEEIYRRLDNGRVHPGSFSGYREVRASMQQHGDDKPIWFTEFGWATTTQDTPLGGVDAATQADYLTRAYEYLEQDPYVEVAAWYSYRNSNWANDADTWEDQLGLVRTDFSPKPAYQAFKAYGAEPPGPVQEVTPEAAPVAPEVSEATSDEVAVQPPAAAALAPHPITTPSRLRRGKGRRAARGHGRKLQRRARSAARRRTA